MSFQYDIVGKTRCMGIHINNDVMMSFSKCHHGEFPEADLLQPQATRKKHLQRVYENTPPQRPIMTPTPSPHASFQDRFHFGRSRRQRNANPYDPSHNVTPTQQAQEPVTPLIDEASRDLVSDPEGELDDEIADEDIEDGVDEEDHDAEEEEGGIEEGSLGFLSIPHHDTKQTSLSLLISVYSSHASSTASRSHPRPYARDHTSSLNHLKIFT